MPAQAGIFYGESMKVADRYRIVDICPALFLMFILSAVVFVYLPGLQGGFIFDDFPNLEDLSFYGGVTDFESFKSFVFNGFSGPLGRPLAMASFLLDGNSWPTSPESFKATNLKIHLLSGLVLIWTTLNLLRLYQFGTSENIRVWVALLSGAIWMLHPYLVSTTLYVVQRMAQLAALFVFAGIAGYLHGRLLIIRGQIKAGYVWMSCFLGGCTVLSVFSKENGILLPLLVLIIEFCSPKTHSHLLVWWKAIFLWFPSVVVIFILLRAIDFSSDAWPNRIYSQPERLLTEARIVWEYLYHLYLPQIEGRGLFQDGYHFSRSFISPPITLVAWVCLVTLIVAAIRLRRRLPILSLALLFFLGAHLIESTVLNLELYFEHRNYAASAFLFLPVAVVLVSLNKITKVWVPVCGIVLMLMMLSFLTWERAKLWADTENLQLYWAASTPESPRALNKIGYSLYGAGSYDRALVHMQEATQNHPNNSFLNISLLLMKVHLKSAEQADFADAAKKIRKQPFDTQATVGMRRLIELAIKERNQMYLEGGLSLLQAAENNVSFMKISMFERLTPYLKGRIYLALGKFDSAYSEFNSAISLYADADASLGIVAEMANSKRPVEALLLLKHAETLLKQQSDSSLRRSRNFYESEYLRLYSVLKDDIAQLGFSLVDQKTPSMD